MNSTFPLIPKLQMANRSTFATFAYLMIGSLVLAATGAISAGKLPSPPPNCASMRIGTARYVKGEVYLASHQDTVALKAFGFQRLEFVGRSPGSVKYAAIWPETVPLDKLASIVSGLDYAERAPETPDEALDPESAIKALRDQEDRAATVGYESQTSYVPVSIRGALREEDVSLTTRGLAEPLRLSRLISLEEWVRINPNAVAGTNFGEGAPRYSRPAESEEAFGFRNVPPSEPVPPAPSPFSIGSYAGPGSLRPYDFGILRTYGTFKTGRTNFPINPPIGGQQRR